MNTSPNGGNGKNGVRGVEPRTSGGEMGALARELEHTHLAVIERVIRSADAERADLIGRRHGYRVEIEPTGCDGWALMVLTADPAPDTAPTTDPTPGLEW